MSAPLVSILVPTYNGERFLKKALRSALEQSHKEIEVLVGDDASTDSTPEILAAVAASDPRVRVIRHDGNLGAFDNPIRLLEAARGEYVKFLMHDDLLMRDCVRDLVRGMESADGVTLAFSRRSFVDEDGRALSGGQPAPLRDRAGVMDSLELGDMMLQGCVNVMGELTTVLFRRSAIDPATLWQVDGRRLAAVGDLCLYLSLLARGPVFYTPRTLSAFRRHGGQRSHDATRVIRGTLDWPLLIDWARRQGFLGDPVQQRRAFSMALRVAADHYAALPTAPGTVAGLEAAYLCTVALAEIDGAIPDDPTRSLLERAHGSAALGRLASVLDDSIPD
jgi:glycosyltransferase involved in cell wall biosynthesis